MSNGNNNGRSVLRGILGMAVIGCLLIGGCCGGCMLVTDISYSDGERTGTITKFSHKGLIWKTYEGEMSLGGFRNQGDKGGVVANVWEFSVDKDNKEIIQQIEEAQRKGGTYTQTLNPAPLKSATGYYVVKITPQGQ